MQKESANCKLEALYAHQAGLKMVPMMLSADYQPNGWLGMLLGTRLWYMFVDGMPAAQLKSKVGEMCREIGPPDQGGGKGRGHQTPRSAPASAPAPAAAPAPAPAPAPTPAAAPVVVARAPAPQAASVPDPSLSLDARSAALGAPAVGPDISAQLLLLLKEQADRMDAQLESQRRDLEELRQQAFRAGEERLRDQERLADKERLLEQARLREQQLAALQSRLESLHAAGLLTEAELFALENLLADAPDDGRVTAMVALASRGLSDAALARQLRRKI